MAVSFHLVSTRPLYALQRILPNRITAGGRQGARPPGRFLQGARPPPLCARPLGMRQSAAELDACQPRPSRALPLALTWGLEAWRAGRRVAVLRARSSAFSTAPAGRASNPWLCGRGRFRRRHGPAAVLKGVNKGTGAGPLLGAAPVRKNRVALFSTPARPKGPSRHWRLWRRLYSPGRRACS